MVLAALMFAATFFVAVPSAQAAACAQTIPNGTYCVIQTGRNYQYELTDVARYPNHENPGNPIGSCINVGGTCSITQGVALTTSVQLALSVDKGAVTGGLTFSASRTSSTAVGCTSPVLRSGQKFVAYRLGTLKLYRVRKTVFTSGSTTRETSARLTGFEPAAGISIKCAVVAA